MRNCWEDEMAASGKGVPAETLTLISALDRAESRLGTPEPFFDKTRHPSETQTIR
jgi:hypothetical protein